MKISVQSQVVVLISLLSGCSIFSILGWRYFALQEQQQNVFTLSQSVSSMSHADTMQMQWLTTLDLFLSDQQSYLVSGIQSQTQQLDEQYQQMEQKLFLAEEKQWLQQMRILLKGVEKGVTLLAYAQSTTPDQWQSFINESDENTGILLELSEVLSGSLQDNLLIQQQTLSDEQQLLVHLAIGLIMFYLLVNILLGWWNTNTIVKPLVALSKRTLERNSEDVRFRIDSGPNEIRTLSNSLHDFATALTHQQQETERLYEAGEEIRKWLSVVMDAAPVAIVTTDDQLSILSGNLAVEKIFSHAQAEFQNTSLRQYFPKLPHNEETLLQEYEDVIGQGKTKRYVEISSEQVDYQGARQWLFIVRDITGRKSSEKREKSLNKQLVKSEKLASLGQLAAGVAHEINNPVGFVKANFKILEEYFQQFSELFHLYRELEQQAREGGGYGALNDSTLTASANNVTQHRESLDLDFMLEDLQDILSSSFEGLNRVTKIAADMKAFAHTEDEQAQEADLNQLIETAIRLTKNDHQHKARIVTEFSSLSSLRCWPPRLTQVLVNLLVNGAQAIEQNGSIKIKTYQQEQTIYVEVLDNGCGMSKEVMEKIFDPFYTTKPVGTGTGLGLHISHSIVEKHGGDIHAKSIPGKGSCFTMTLPVDYL